MSALGFWWHKLQCRLSQNSAHYGDLLLYVGKVGTSNSPKHVRLSLSLASSFWLVYGEAAGFGMKSFAIRSLFHTPVDCILARVSCLGGVRLEYVSVLRCVVIRFLL